MGPHLLRHHRGWNSDRSEKLPGREVHPSCEDARGRRGRELQGPEGRADCSWKLHRGSLSVRCPDPAVHHSEEQGYQKVFGWIVRLRENYWLRTNKFPVLKYKPWS